MYLTSSSVREDMKKRRRWKYVSKLTSNSFKLKKEVTFEQYIFISEGNSVLFLLLHYTFI